MRRTAWILIVFFPATLLALAAQPVSTFSPNDHVLLAADWMSRQLKAAAAGQPSAFGLKDAGRVRFISFYATPEEKLADRRKVTWTLLRSMTRARALKERPREVPNSAGTLFWLDLEDYDWNAAAWQAVARRQPFFKDTWIDLRAADYLRDIAGVNRGKDGNVEAIVWADWLIEDTSDTGRSASYYDLLYADARFPGIEWREKPEPGWYHTGAKGKANFPENETDFQVFFGADGELNILKDRKRKLEFDEGVIVDERDSIVALHNRLLWSFRIGSGSYRQSFDFIKTAGRRDLIENPTLAADPTKLEHDASEYIVNLPNGGQAYLLANGAGKRIEFAEAQNIAIDRTDTIIPVVRTPRSCIICHARGRQVPGGNLVQGTLEAGVTLNVRLKKDKLRIEGFFLGGEISENIQIDQIRYAKFVLNTSGLKPEVYATNYKEALDWYEGFVTPTQMAKEAGLPLAQFKGLAAHSGSARLNRAVQGLGMPRTAWDEDWFPRIMKMWVAQIQAEREAKARQK